MPDCEKASQLRQLFPGVSIGIHWTLTHGYPVLGPARIPTLTDDSGRFFHQAEFKKKWITGKVRKADIQEELIAQYRRFQDIVGSADYWNSHQHVHVFPGLFRLFTDVGKSLCIGKMRCNTRITVPYMATATQYHLKHPLYFFKQKLVSQWSSWAEKQGMAMPHGLINFVNFPERTLVLENVIKEVFCSEIPAPLELMIHQAREVVTEHFDNLRESRIREYEYFRKPDVADRLQNLGSILPKWNYRSVPQNT
jgi:predicted glycoside hydrolase/deacetylase ChbG (UPF0249 family)